MKNIVPDIDLYLIFSESKKQPKCGCHLFGLFSKPINFICIPKTIQFEKAM